MGAPFIGSEAVASGALTPYQLRTRFIAIHRDVYIARGIGLTAVVRAHARPEHCHEWRKRAKDHWYDIRLLEGVWTEETKTREKSLKDLETALGDHHNLEVLKGTLAAHPAAYGPREDIDLCLALIERYQKDLLESALTLGARVYEERPAQFRTRLLLQLDELKRLPA